MEFKIHIMKLFNAEIGICFNGEIDCLDNIHIVYSNQVSKDTLNVIIPHQNYVTFCISTSREVFFAKCESPFEFQAFKEISLSHF